MADTTTTNYNFTKPEVGASDNSWGDKLNANWDAVDAALAAVSATATTADTSALKIANNLSDLNDVPTARSNLVVPGLTVANVFTKTQTWTKGTNVASASALNLGDGNYFDITGSTAITSIGTKGVGTIIRLHFNAALTLTHHATDLILFGSASIDVQAGDEAVFIEYAVGDWRMIGFERANGLPLAFIDEDSMASDSATKVPSQQSVKAYVDTSIAGIPSNSIIDLVDSVTVSAQATLDLTGVFTTDYDYYVIELHGVFGSTDNQNLLMRFGRSGSFLSGSNYRYAGRAESSDNTTALRFSGTSATEIEIANAVQNSAGRGARATVKVFTPADTVNSAGITSHSSHASSALWRDQTMSGAYFNDVLAMDDIQFFMSSGNISGTARVYGYKTS